MTKDNQVTKSTRRQIPSDLNKEDFKNKLSLIERFFDTSWLERPKAENRLQKLWQRQDSLSSIELYTFGCAISTFAELHHNWLRHQIKQIKGNDENNQSGALFEVCGLNLFSEHAKSVNPSELNRKGIDGEILYPNSKKIHLSIKSFGYSSHQGFFVRNCKKITNIVSSGHKDPVLLKVEFFRYPCNHDWNSITSTVESMLRAFNGSECNKHLTGIDDISLSPLAAEQCGTFNSNRQSYTSVFVSPFHANEKKNLVSKLDSAADNILRHSTITENDIAGILVHIPPDSPITELASWTRQYLFEAREKISFIIFIQSEYGADSHNRTLHLKYHFQAIKTSTFDQWSKTLDEKRLHLTVPVGIITQDPIKIEITKDAGHIKINDRYIYQEGNHYINAAGDNNKFKGTMKRLAYGVFQHTILRLSDGEVLVSAKQGNNVLIL